MKEKEVKKKSIISSRDRTDPVLEKFIRKFPSYITPNLLTVISFILALIYAFFIWFSGTHNFPFGLFLALIFLFFSSAFDALDGVLARKRNMQSRWGDYLDHALDRVADISFLVAIILGGYIRYEIGLFSIIGVFLTSNFGALAKGAGLSREYGGMMGRAYRLIILMIATFLNGVYLEKFGIGGASFTFLGWAMVIFAVGGIITACQRFYKTRKALIGSESR